MKKIIALLVILVSVAVFGPVAHAYTSVKGYYKSNGTYVQPHVRSSPNALKYDNYNYKSGSTLYNSSYYKPTKSYSSSWYTPSYSTDSSYYYGKSIYDSYNYSW